MGNSSAMSNSSAGPNSDDVVIMTDSQGFIDQVTNNNGIGTISSVYSLLYQEIGLPKNLRLTPLNRQNRILDQMDYAACTLYRFKSSERAQKYAFSEPIYFLLHYRLYKHVDTPPMPPSAINSNNEIHSLLALYESNKAATFLFIPTYSYGDVLDKQIAALPTSAKVEWTGNSPHNRLSNLFFARRAHYALMFPGEVKEYMQFNPPQAYESFSVANVPSTTRGYMMCNKHPASYAYIDLVNKTMESLYSRPLYLEAHTSPYNESEHPLIKRKLKVLIKDNK